MWASVQKETPPREPDYSSIEELFCLPVIEPKDKRAAAPAKKEPKEVRLATNPSDQQSLAFCLRSYLFFLFVFVDNVHWPQKEFKYEHISEAVQMVSLYFK